MRSARCCTGDVGPQMWMSRPGANNGPEEAEALQVVHVQVREHDVQLDGEVVLHRDAERAHAGTGVEHDARGRSSSRTSTHDVLPPYLTVSGPGAATDPRHPQTRACISRRVFPGRALPEHRDHAVHLAGRAEQRIRGRLVRRARTPLYGGGHDGHVRGPVLVERDARRRVAPADRLAVGRRELQRRAELARRDLAELGERLAEQQRGRVVVEHEHAARVEQEHRRGQVRRQLAREDQRQALRRSRRAERLVHGVERVDNRDD